MDMNNNKIIKYENVRNENYRMINFHKNGTIEHMLVHEFETDNGKDYLVVGKSTASIPNIVKEGTGWSNIIAKVVSIYQNNSEMVLNSNETTYYDVANIPNFYLTKEGYDLITHKFLFTNNEIIRTVSVDRQQRGNEMCYMNEYKLLDGSEIEYFRTFDFYEKVYTLRDYEFQNLDIANLSSYVSANFNKCKKVIALAVQDGVLFRQAMEEFFSSGDNLEILNQMVVAIEAINTINAIRERNKNKGKAI